MTDSTRSILWILTLVAPLVVVADPGHSDTPKLIPYKVVEREVNAVASKLSLTIEVPLVGGRLPSKEELNEIAKHLVGTPKHQRTFVLFYLPGMEIGAGAYATAHYLPEPEGVKLVPMALLDTDYEHLDPDLVDLRRSESE